MTTIGPAGAAMASAFLGSQNSSQQRPPAADPTTEEQQSRPYQAAQAPANQAPPADGARESSANTSRGQPSGARPEQSAEGTDQAPRSLIESAASEAAVLMAAQSEETNASQAADPAERSRQNLFLATVGAVQEAETRFGAPPPEVTEPSGAAAQEPALGGAGAFSQGVNVFV